MPKKLDYNLDISSDSRWNMISATATAKSSLIYAQEIGDFRAGPDYYTSREQFDSYLIKLTLSGCGELIYGGQRYMLTPGQFFWIDCRKPQHYRTAPGHSDWHILWVHLSGGNARAYYDAFLNYNGGSATGVFANMQKGVNLFNALLELDPSGPDQMMVDFRASELLTQLIVECVLCTMSTDRTGDMLQLVQGVRTFLKNNFREKFTLEELGSRFSINPQYLQKQFKRHLGMSPSEYQIFLRMTAAKELLRSTKMSIGDIALSVGISNMGYFTRRFKQQEGITPQTYRKLWPILEHPVSERFAGVNREEINQE